MVVPVRLDHFALLIALAVLLSFVLAPLLDG